jgi:hypothetical protein
MELILTIPRRDRIFKIKVDVSNYAKGTILYQEQDRVFKNIAYLLLQSPDIKLQDERQLVLGLHSWND